jgi:hypothetical protein
MESYIVVIDKNKDKKINVENNEKIDPRSPLFNGISKF